LTQETTMVLLGSIHSLWCVSSNFASL
jgi:hypothetical protein